MKTMKDRNCIVERRRREGSRLDGHELKWSRGPSAGPFRLRPSYSLRPLSRVMRRIQGKGPEKMARMIIWTPRDFLERWNEKDRINHTCEICEFDKQHIRFHQRTDKKYVRSVLSFNFSFSVFSFIPRKSTDWMEGERKETKGEVEMKCSVTWTTILDTWS